ncbi:D-alanyl-D-alanine carboxypeptidase/D-alanyl-D-alanine endopeptidase [Modestobacter italicus]|uniref:D-alanyl-D-alanine carboxypeptidase/D-alanyl-D-alanine endopeptidase n=1 Tax=Modestobacter italicus (strain DSM 44449 / CECT 9708 / BC 501) TaxID=2732864 RepID=UPI001E57581B|nr:D-alanyl-D-alanine carboxypeptidase/D-alanyl-D-alanine-endopeptidase [Modestobacter marinus]
MAPPAEVVEPAAPGPAADDAGEAEAGPSEADRAAAQAAADLAAVKQWAAERAAAERAAAEAAAEAAAAQAAAEDAELERARAEQAAADLAAVREWAAQRAAAEQAAEEQAAADRAAAEEQAATDRAAAEAARAEADRAAAEQAEAEQRAAEQVAADRAAAERAAQQEEQEQQEAAERAQRQLEQQEAAATAQRAAAQQAAERADVQRAQEEWAAGRHSAVRAPVGDEQRPERPRPTPRARGASAAPATGRRRAAEPPPDAGTAPRPAGRRRRTALVAALLALVLVVAAGVLVTLRLTDRSGSTVAADAEQVPDAVLPELSDPGPVLTALGTDAPLPDPTALAGVLSPLLAAPALGGGLSAQVVDVATGQVLFDRDAADPSTPASTAKLLTGLAVLTTLDPTDTLSTSVVAGSSPGQVVLVGGGDPTLSTTDPSTDYPGAATVADLAAQVTQALGGQPVTGVVVDNSLFTGPLTASGWGADDAPSSYAAPVTATAVDGARVAPGESQRSGSPGTDAGRALAAALGAPDVPVDLGQAPAGARTLGTVESAPVDRLVEEALNASDNLLAESLGRQVALARGLPASFDGAADAITAALTDAGLDTTGLDLHDASGLSQDDRVPAHLLVDVVRAAADGSADHADGLLSGLPVAGYDGTLAERVVAGGQAGPGSVRAKTGTLLGTNDLAGTVLTADGRLLAFAVMADGTVGSLTAGEGSLDVVADALAGCGCR